MRKKNGGITLIALVVTIVVLLILAGVSISMLGGENGIITQANRAKENTRGGEVKEEVDRTVNENTMINYTTGTKKTREEVIEKLKTDKKIIQEEYNKLMGLEGETKVDIIKIGDIEVDFSKLVSEEGTTSGDIYNEDMIGTEIKNDQ